MANVAFRRGNLADIPQALTDGTLYITTDEGAMYLDTASRRVRLGDFIPVNTVNDLPATGHAYETALYYVKTGNILARWDATNSRWIQINKAGVVNVSNDPNNAVGANVVSAITPQVSADGQLTLIISKATVATSEDLEQLQLTVAGHTSAINTINGNGVGSISKAVSDATAALLGSPTTYTTIEALETALAAVKSTADSAAAQATTNAQDIDALELDVAAIKQRLGTGNNSLESRVAANESAISTLNGDANTDGSVLNTVNTRIAQVVNGAPEAFDTLKEIADWIGNNSDDALTMQQNISQNATDIAGLKQRMTAAEGSINTINGDATTVGSINYAVAQEAAARAAADSAQDALIAANASDIGDLQTDVATLKNNLAWKSFTQA